MDQEERQHGATMQEMSEAHKDLLRNLIDQQLWLSKGKELGITGETELVNRLNEIRKQYNLATLEDLEKAAQDQGVCFEDFKANIRNGIVTQEVMRQEVGRRIPSRRARCSATSRRTSRTTPSRRACSSARFSSPPAPLIAARRGAAGRSAEAGRSQGQGQRH